ncbi:helix-turn-helix transcriptional regulator [Segatella salivae]|jgi:putative phage repressor|uniref:Peptidase S24-like protein n=1 Tax=Segatella salivae DSM 15606 TaxID=888832 RepID=E6MTS3_9BACT|nr:S24 family peptidase [Segatella salivae]EFV02970.1 peptidase S24-like protein [Segatella salivae DSM 15606]
MILERIKEYIDCKGITVAAFERSIGMSNASFGKSLKNRGAIGSDKIENILSVYTDLSSEWLLTGKGDMLKSDNEKLIEAHKTFGGSAKSSNKQKGIPLIPIDAVAGFPSDDNDGVYMEDCEHYSIPEFEAKGANFLIRVSGDSMHPLYENGDIIACRKISDILFFQWGGIYVLDTSQGALVKRVEEAEDDKESILCISENPRFKPFRLPKSDIRSLSTIVGLVRLV